MFKIYPHRKLKKKAYIFIYTIFAVIILITLINYTISLNISNITINNYIKNYQLKSDIKEDNKEVLLGRLYNSINKTAKSMNYEEIKRCLKSELNNDLRYEQSFIEYVQPEEKYTYLEPDIYFQVVTEFSPVYKIKEIYKCTIEDEKLRFIYVLADTY
ncbi:hypothetical protein [Haloimpatiens massiliensis]|uniref:hypothetical protein n=1 Tax=Haloimpatiens massiliensis TaxID=1658110 RepID=UPI000C83A2F5|nr:hypothetical protein [Haloimpatiens massiliensis]